MSSMDTDIVKSWYVSVSLDKDHSVQWIKQVKWILLMSGKSLYGLKVCQLLLLITRPHPPIAWYAS